MKYAQLECPMLVFSTGDGICRWRVIDMGQNGFDNAEKEAAAAMGLMILLNGFANSSGDEMVISTLAKFNHISVHGLGHSDDMDLGKQNLSSNGEKKTYKCAVCFKERAHCNVIKSSKNHRCPICCKEFGTAECKASAGNEEPLSAKRKASAESKRLAECKASASNLRVVSYRRANWDFQLVSELRKLSAKVDQLESSIFKKVTKAIQSSVPSLITVALKEQLSELLSETLKTSIPLIIKDSIKEFVVKPMDKQFHSFNTLESRRFVTLQKEMRKVLKTKMGKFVRKKGEQSVNEESALVLHASVEKSAEVNTSQKEEINDEPALKKLKFLILAPTPLNSVLPEPLQKPDATTMSSDQFTEHLFKTTSSINSSSPPRDQSPPRSLAVNMSLNQDSSIPPKHDDKGKGVIIEEDPLKELIPLMDEGGSNLKIPMTMEDFKAQLAELQRLEALKQEEEKSEESLKKIMKPANIQAQAKKITKYEEKKAKMLAEYNHYIRFRADKRRITKINYIIDRVTKNVTMRIQRDNQPLSLPVLEIFWLKKEKKASKKLKDVFVKEDIKLDGMYRNLIPPQGVVGFRGLVITEPEAGIFYYNGNFDMAFQRKNEFHLSTTPQLIRLQNDITSNIPKAEEMYKKLEFAIVARNDVARQGKLPAECKATAGSKGLAECKTLESNLRGIQVKDIVKEVEDYLKTYSSSEMDSRWLVGVVGEEVRRAPKPSPRYKKNEGIKGEISTSYNDTEQDKATAANAALTLMMLQGDSREFGSGQSSMNLGKNNLWKTFKCVAFGPRLHKVMHGPKPNKTIRRHNGPKLSQCQTCYGPEAARRTKGFRRTLSQGSGSLLGKPNEGGHWKSRSKKKKSRREDDDLSHPWGGSGSLESRAKEIVSTMETVEGNQKQNFKKEGFRNQQRPKKKQDRLTLLTKTPKEIFTLEKRKFKAQPPMTTPVENRNHTKFCEFHGQVGHNTDEYEKEGTEGPMIIEAEIGGHCVHRMYVDGGSDSKILYEHCFNRLRLKIKNQLVPATTPLIGFSDEIIWPIQQIQLLVNPAGMYVGLQTKRDPPATKPILEERVKVAINPEYSKQAVMIGSTLTEGGRNKLCGLLQCNLDIFAWKPADMIGIPRHIAEHRLNMREGCSPVRQKKRGQAADRNQAIQEEVMKLVEAGIIKEVHYHEWLSNLVMVKKHDDSWRIKDVLRIQSQHQWAKSMSRQGRRCLKSSIPKVLERRTKVKREARKPEQLIAELPILTAPMENEELIVYLAAAKETVSAVLMTEREAKQMPIYFLSRALRGSEINYTSMEKPRVSVKGQILADFIVERPEEDSLDTLMEVEEELLEPWILFTDGSSCTDGSRVGLMLINPKGMEFTYALRFSLGKRIKARLDARSKNWIEELPHVLWAHCTMIKSRNGDTPFSLTYGTEAIIPAKIDMPTLRTAKVDLVQNDEAMGINLDHLEEKREQAAIRKAKMEKYYNFKVRSASFKPGDLVYHKNDASRMEDTWKLGPTWEGPYEVTEALGKGAYKLRDRDRKQLPRT
nr:reverse transcriptase domain-containing protein [Tanacetum cinerariifolium]